MTVQEGIDAGTVLPGGRSMPLEAGHISIDRNGPACNCGNRGCLETLCSTTALFARLRAVDPESAARLHDLSPLAIIGRGYAMAKGADGRVVSSVDGVAAGDRLVVALSDGELDCTVDDVRRIHSAVEVWD